jgi:predicted O-methyltransferase YrrM
VTSATTLADPKVAGLLVRLHAAARAQTGALLRHYLPHLPRVLLGKRLPWNRLQPFYSDKFVALEPAQGMLCYLLARAGGARCVVEFGTSFGVSTLYLAAAVRDNGGGVVIGSEIVPEKAARALEHVHEAGLQDFVEIRAGDARETLADLDRSVDFFLNDGFPPLALPVLRVVAPHLRIGAQVLSDNVGMFRADLADYVTWLRDPANGFLTQTLPYKGGTELSVRTGAFSRSAA